MIFFVKSAALAIQRRRCVAASTDNQPTINYFLKYFHPKEENEKWIHFVLTDHRAKLSPSALLSLKNRAPGFKQGHSANY